MGTLAKQFTILIKKKKTKQEPAGKQLNEQLRACDHVTEDLLNIQPLICSQRQKRKIQNHTTDCWERQSPGRYLVWGSSVIWKYCVSLWPWVCEGVLLHECLQLVKRFPRTCNTENLWQSVWNLRPLEDEHGHACVHRQNPFYLFILLHSRHTVWFLCSVYTSQNESLPLHLL